jgi:small GTP-binding protein
LRGVFDEETQSTLGIEFMTKILQTDKYRIQLQLWDTGGQELFRSVTRGYYRGAAGVLLLFDMTNHDSFKHVARWLADVRENARRDLVAILIGNWSDMAHKRAVTRDEAEQFAEAQQMKYFETSAKTGAHVGDAVAACIDVIEKRVADGAYQLTPGPDDEPMTTGETTEKSLCSC